MIARQPDCSARNRRAAPASDAPHANRSRSRAATIIFAGVLCALLVSPHAPVLASPQQAPNSRVVLDLPAGYTPSPLFSGFQNEEQGVSYVILEVPEKSYAEIAKGFAVDELAKRGLTDAEPLKLSRGDTFTAMRANQISPAGAFAKFFVLFKTEDQAVLVSVSVPQSALEKGTVQRSDIERALSSASTAPRATAKELYHLPYLGPFREAGTFVGTGKLYTLDGRMEPERKGETRSALVVAPSIDKRPLGDPEALAKALLTSLSGYRDVKIRATTRIMVDGHESVELEAKAIDIGEGREVQLYQALVPALEGGYFRLVGIATAAQAAELVPEFRKIAGSFRIVR